MLGLVATPIIRCQCRTRFLRFHYLLLNSHATLATDEENLNLRRSHMNIYVGNLPFSMTEEELESSFAAHGEVQSARIITDRFTGQSRGFGFVEMSDNGAAEAAIQALNGQELQGRPLTVNEARPREDRGSGGGGGGGGNRGGGGGGGGGRW